jgi:hypothetical protein
VSKVYEIKVIRGTQSCSREHFFCNLCGFILKTALDHQHHSDHSCCHECYLTFAESRKEDWKAGWRPKKNEIRKYINGRKRLLINASKRQEIK